MYRNAEAVTVRRENYRAPAFWIDRIHLEFDLDPTRTRVRSTLAFRKNTDVLETTITLLGERQKFLSVTLNGKALAANQYLLTESSLTIADAPIGGELVVESEIDPEGNLALEGLYLTSGVFCTQCEAEGFRRITYFPDRPDVLSEYTVTIRADKRAYPVLLANGNLISKRDLDGGRHEAVWHDPHKKPSYLFALVAGNIDKIADTFTTMSDREVLLEIYSTTANLPRCTWAMECLKASMKWDEEAYGREYDLDRFMIYAADDFNMGAMENKGLNIFNSRYLLADKDIATDNDFEHIDAIVAHEYFHNWSGNRVTCRDWFQLSLKEGFTVFREQQYSAFRGSPEVIRIAETAFMQAHQFPQDAGPMAHPVRPDEYEAIDNFYTVTVYEKGSEVIRMLRTLLGAEAYRKGCDLYFERHDGTAATCDDFVAAMEATSGKDLSQFKRWYTQAGTPVITAKGSYDANTKRYSLSLSQNTPSTPGQPVKSPMVIPVSVALVEASRAPLHERVLTLTEPSQTFVFESVASEPTPSLLRGFSAPVRVDFDYSVAQLATLATHDTDGVVRWQAMRDLFLRAFNETKNGNATMTLAKCVGELLADAKSDPALLAQLLCFASEDELAERVTIIDTDAIANRRGALLAHVVSANRDALLARYTRERAALVGRTYSTHAKDAARRALAAATLCLANAQSTAQSISLAKTLYENADNLTDVEAAMRALRDVACPERDAMYAKFHDRWQDEATMLNRWYTFEATSRVGDARAALTRVHRLLAHPKFDNKNPNRVRAVVQQFAMNHWRGFHAADGSGYEFVADQIIAYDANNPSLAARFCNAFSRWNRFEPKARTLQERALKRIQAVEKLSPNVGEWIEKTLAAA
ncbi:MAG: aminopeptidase N [Casimicrobium sp.]